MLKFSIHGFFLALVYANCRVYIFFRVQRRAIRTNVKCVRRKGNKTVKNSIEQALLNLLIFRFALRRNSSEIFVGSALSVPGASPGGISSFSVRRNISAIGSGSGLEAVLREDFVLDLTEVFSCFTSRSLPFPDEAFLSLFPFPMIKHV